MNGRIFGTWLGAGLLLALCGCQSPYRADKGALLGGLGGAGLGAIIGHQTGHAGAGAVLGGAAGTIAGAAIGGEMDRIAAENQARIEAQLGHKIRAGAVTLEDVIAMSRAGVGDELIVTHVRAHGIVRPLTPQDLIVLKEAGVSDRVVAAMQEPPLAQVPPPGERVIVEEHHYGYPPPRYYWPQSYWHHRAHHHRHHRPGWSVGVGFSN